MARVRTEKRDGVFIAITEPTTDEERGTFKAIEDWRDENGAPIQRYTHADGRSEMWRCAHNGQDKQRLKDDGTVMLADELPELPMVGVRLPDDEGLDDREPERDFYGVPLDAATVGGWRVWTERDGASLRARRGENGLEVQELAANGRYELTMAHDETASKAAALWQETADRRTRSELAEAALQGADSTYDSYVLVGGSEETHSEWALRTDERRAGGRSLAQIEPARLRAEVAKAAADAEAWAVIERRQQLDQRREAIEKAPDGGFYERGNGRRRAVFSARQLKELDDIADTLDQLPTTPQRPSVEPPHRVGMGADGPTDEQLRALYPDMPPGRRDGENLDDAPPAQATA